MSIVMLAYDRVRLLDVTGPLEVFATSGIPVILCSPDGRDVVTSSGLRIGVNAAVSEITGAHTVIVPGSDDLPGGAFPAGSLDGVATLARDARRIASVCTGAFALAEVGLLDGLRATTHWRHTTTFARRYPRVEVEPDAIYVRDGRMLTSAGVSAGIDLALAMVEEDGGADLAREVARDMVVFLQRPGGQSQFSVAARTPRARHDGLRRLLDAVVADPAADHSLPALAVRGGFSVRHLTRLFREQIGGTPAAYVESVRLEAARALLEAGETVTAAADRTGLGSEESLRRIFHRHLGVAPSSYRARFRGSRR
jgi:transcriptional regulator GlxA family with amidase domain